MVEFHREHGPLGYSERLAVALRNSAARHDEAALRPAVEAFGKVDDPRVASILLALYRGTSDAELRRTLAFGLRYQSAPSALAVYRRELLANCERLRDLQVANPSPGIALSRLGYLMSDTHCDVSHLTREAPPPAPAPSGVSYPPHVASRRAALAPFGLAKGLLYFPAEGVGALASHAPLMRRLADLVRPDLDNLVLEEVWPALDDFVFDRGPVSTFASVDGWGFNVRVRGTEQEPEAVHLEEIEPRNEAPKPARLEVAPDLTHLAQVTQELREALAKPHFVDAYLDGAVASTIRWT